MCRRATTSTACSAARQQILDELFPGFSTDLVARGVPAIDQLRDARLYFSGHRLRQAEGGGVVVSASRPCLEGYVRKRVRSLPGVTFADRRDVLSLAATSDHDRVTGVRVIRRVDSSTEETLDSDLVVDATGRGSRTPHWLEALGYGRPTEDKVAADIAYATAIRVGATPQPLANRRGGTDSTKNKQMCLLFSCTAATLVPGRRMRSFRRGRPRSGARRFGGRG